MYMKFDLFWIFTNKKHFICIWNSPFSTVLWPCCQSWTPLSLKSSSSFLSRAKLVPFRQFTTSKAHRKYSCTRSAVQPAKHIQKHNWTTFDMLSFALLPNKVFQSISSSSFLILFFLHSIPFIVGNSTVSRDVLTNRSAAVQIPQVVQFISQFNQLGLLAAVRCVFHL